MAERWESGIGSRASSRSNAELAGAWIPQLNTISQGQVNELLPTLALQLQIPGNRFRPYVVLGGGHESFHFEAPVVPGTHNLKFWTGHTGVGFRLKLANWAALRTEANAQVSGHRPSWGAFSGVSFYPGARKSEPMVVAAPPVVQHDTVTVRERVVDTVVKVDTMQVNTRTQITTSDTVTRTVEGARRHSRAARRELRPRASRCSARGHESRSTRSRSSSTLRPRAR